MRLLLISYECDYCDGLIGDDTRDVGYIIYNKDWIGEESSFFLFQKRTHAAVWRAHRGNENHPIRKVYTFSRIMWDEFVDDAIAGLIVSKLMYTIFPTKNCEPAINHGLLAD